jgi:hypothetical protein
MTITIQAILFPATLIRSTFGFGDRLHRRGALGSRGLALFRPLPARRSYREMGDHPTK